MNYSLIIIKVASECAAYISDSRKGQAEVWVSSCRWKRTTQDSDNDVNLTQTFSKKKGYHDRAKTHSGFSE